MKLFIINGLTGLEGFVIKALFVKRLAMIDFVFIYFGVETHKLFVNARGVVEILVLIVAVG